MSDYAEHPLPPARREARDISHRVLGLGLLGVLLVLAMLTGLIFWMFPEALRDQSDIKPVPDFPAPRLQPSPPADLKTFLQQQIGWLNSAGWVDRKAGRVHIPITDAMRKIASRGIADWPRTAPTEIQR